MPGLVPDNIDEDVGYSTVGLRAGTLWHWHDMVRAACLSEIGRAHV